MPSSERRRRSETPPLVWGGAPLPVHAEQSWAKSQVEIPALCAASLTGKKNSEKGQWKPPTRCFLYFERERESFLEANPAQDCADENPGLGLAPVAIPDRTR